MWETLDLPEKAVQQINDNGILFLRTGFDAGVHPSWYQAAFHNEKYVREHWRRWFKIAGHRQQGLTGMQDIVIAQK
jgi:hypothetical protein